MRMVLPTLAVVCAALTVQAADEKYNSKEGRFAVRFPTDAGMRTESKTAGGIAINSVIVTANGQTHIAMYMDLPASAKDVPAKMILDSAEKNSLAKGGTLESSKDIEFGKDKFPGREVVLEKGGHKVKTRIIVVATRVYVIVVGGPKDFATTTAGSKFFDSFELTQ